MRTTSWVMTFLRIAAVILPAAVHAAADGDSTDAVVISATRVPTPELEVASSMTVVTAEDIAARQQRTVADVLRDLPGLNVIQAGGPGGQTSVFMRGTNPNHTKVLIDGIDVSDPSNPSADFDFGPLLTGDIERIEVLRGPQSGLYGSDAVGGVINILTRSGAGPARLSAAVEGGSFDTFNQNASLRGAIAGLHYSADLEHFHAGATPVTPLGLLLPGERRNDDYDDNLTFAGKLGYELTPQFDLGLVARYTDAHLRLTGDDFSTFPAFPEAQQTASDSRRLFSRGSAHLSSFDGLFDQTLGIAFSHSRSSNLDPQLGASLNIGDRVKIDWQGNVRLSEAQTVVLGAEHERDSISQPISAATRLESGYLELQSRLGALSSAINVRYDDNDRFGGKATYRIAPTYFIAASGTKLKASVGTGFKAPSLTELFESFPPFFFANPNLKPESSTGYDAGVEQNFGEQWRAGVTYFYNRIRNLITTDATGLSEANVGRATTDGVESFIAYRPTQALSVRVDYTYTEAVDDVLDQELLRRPKHKGSADLTWRAARAVTFSATFVTVSSWIDGNRDFSIPRLSAPGYSVLNLAASYDLDAHVSLFGRIDNLLDRRYQNPTGFLQPSRGVFAGVRASL